MTSWREEIERAVSAFVAVAELAGDSISRSDIEVEFLPAPHRQPSRLPSGKRAVIAFWHDDEWLTVSRVGPNSAPRYLSQHYNRRSDSTLARSLVNDPRMAAVAGFDPDAPGDWIRQETCRVNILLPANRSRTLLALLSTFLQVRLRPRYDG
jgi:hypothetical protein